MKRLFSSLRARLLLLVILASVPSFALVLFSGLEQRQAAAKQAQNQALHLTKLASAEHQRLIAETRRILIALAEIPSLNTPDIAACGPLLASLLKQYPQFSNMYVAVPNGDVVCSATPTQGPQNFADRLWFQEATRTKQFAQGDYVIGRISGKATLLTGMPLLDAQGNVRLLLHAGIDLSWLNAFANEANLPDGSRLAVVKPDGELLVRWPEPAQWVGRNLSGGGLVTPLVVAGQREGVGEGVGAEGVSRLFAFTPLDAAGAVAEAFISVAVPTASAYAAVDLALQRALIGFVLAMVLALVAAWLGSDLFVLRRLRVLMAASQRLAQGDLTARSGFRSNSELGRLGAAFDHMAAALEERNLERDREAAERHRLMEQIDHERASLAGIVTSMSQGVVMVGATEAVSYASARAGALLGIRSETLVGLHADEALALIREANLVDRAAVPTWREIRGGIADYPSIEISYKTTPPRDLRLDFFPVTGEESERGGFGMLVRDVTTERDVARAKDALISIISHELRTPLTSIRSYSELLLTYDDPDVRQEFLSVINSESERLSRLLNETLDLAKIGSGNFDLNATELDPTPVLQDCVKLYQPLASQQHLDILVNLAPDLGEVLMNADRLKQVVCNLLDNALKFTPVGGIWLTAERRDGQLLIGVKDSGIGIEPHNLDAIFERFHQGGMVVSGKPRGLGLGLSLCREIVQRYMGRIWVESEVGKGSTFYVQFPLLPAPTLPVGTEDATPV